MSASDRVAVVVVHGIADQRPGQTVREVARLLCLGGNPCVQGEMQEVLVPVEKLEPGDDARRAEAGKRRGTRRKPGTPSGFYQYHGDRKPDDLGIALNDYLLGRLELPEGDALYESTRVTLRRKADGRALDLYEMYWADLSRLSAGGLSVLLSLYQLFFHLNTLAADVVDQVALTQRRGGAWRALQSFHAWMAWLLKGPVALLQLAMLLVVAFGATALVARELQGQLLAAAFGLSALVLLGTAVLGWLRGAAGPARAAKALALVVAAVASLATALYALDAEEVPPLLYFGAGALAVALLGFYLVERYSGVTEGVRVLGHFIVLATVGGLGINGVRVLPDVSTQIEWMVAASCQIGEWLLAAVLLVWALFVAIQILSVLLGLWLGRGSHRGTHASLHTARLAVICSSGLFAVLSLVLWSVISFVAGRALTDVFYQPVIFEGSYRSAGLFLEDRVQALGGFFTPLVLGFGILVAATLLVVLPSLMEEISPSVNVDANGVRKGAVDWARRLGAWLGAGIRTLGAAFKFLVPLGAVAAGGIYIAFVLQELAFTTGIGAQIADLLVGALELFKGETLVAAGKWLAGGALTIAALGSRFTETFGRLRVGIDAVLDIDNYFGDPPNRQPPRGRIFSRYAALLAHLGRAGYARIVIVAHSQGTVISAELLRYLHVQGRLRAIVGARPVALVTVGSPLRDLYAERFPLLYRWMGSRDAGFVAAGPAAADLGIAEWVNACRSGDYVGRFIWSSDRNRANFRVATVGADGRVEASRAADRAEFCLGAGGHTHYFSNDAVALAAEIERLADGAPA